MKFIFISIFMVFATVINAATITSPTFMPKANQVTATMEAGYNDIRYKDGNIKGKQYNGYNGILKGQFGLKERLALNYGIDYGFKQKIRDNKVSGEFNNYYFGLTGRAVDNFNKLDISFNIGNSKMTGANYAQIETYTSGLDTSVPFANLGISYGFDAKLYSVMFGINSIYYGEERSGDEKYNKQMDFIFSMENEFSLSEKVVLGLDLYYSIVGNNKLYSTTQGPRNVDNKNIFGVNADLNYSLNEKNYFGVYFKLGKENSKYSGIKYEAYGHSYGVKLVSLF